MVFEMAGKHLICLQIAKPPGLGSIPRCVDFVMRTWWVVGGHAQCFVGLMKSKGKRGTGIVYVLMFVGWRGIRSAGLGIRDFRSSLILTVVDDGEDRLRRASHTPHATRYPPPLTEKRNGKPLFAAREGGRSTLCADRPSD